MDGSGCRCLVMYDILRLCVVVLANLSCDVESYDAGSYYTSRKEKDGCSAALMRLQNKISK